MCLIVWAWKAHPTYKLVLAANRDEFYDRPTQPAHYWEEAPSILAGRDLKNGGTWMGISEQGQFGALTNYRDGFSDAADAPSRGHLVSDFLKAGKEPADYLSRVHQDNTAYNGYNLLLGNADGLAYYSNREGQVKSLESGVYGLSNHLLNTPWPKVVKARNALESAIRQDVVDHETLFMALRDKHRAPDDELPDTGIPLEWERRLSSVFIELEEYGTRCSTVLLVDYDGGVQFWEKTHPLPTQQAEEHVFQFHYVPA